MFGLILGVQVYSLEKIPSSLMQAHSARLIHRLPQPCASPCLPTGDRLTLSPTFPLPRATPDPEARPGWNETSRDLTKPSDPQRASKAAGPGREDGTGLGGKKCVPLHSGALISLIDFGQRSPASSFSLEVGTKGGGNLALLRLPPGPQRPLSLCCPPPLPGSPQPQGAH